MTELPDHEENHPGLVGTLWSPLYREVERGVYEIYR